MTDKAFRRDLIVLQNQGRPLWDGVSQIHVRGASPEEAAKWQSGKLLMAKPGSFSWCLSSILPMRFDDDDDDHDNDPD